MKRIITKFEDIGKVAKEIGKLKNVKAVYLFGSYAKGKQGPLSDIDICVIGNLSEKEERETFRFSSDNIDISIFNRLPIYIKMRVFNYGRPLFIKDEDFIKTVKLKTLREYLDFKPAINKFIKETLGCTI